MIGCDVGSQGTNAALYAADGRLVASAYEAYDVDFPHPGWAEQDPRLWTAALHASIARVLAEAPEGPAAVTALSFGSQLDGMVVCDAKGEPLRPAMIWMDRRAEPQAAAVAGKLSPADFYHHTGANLDSSHAVFKALWVRDEEPEVFAEAAHLMPPGSYAARGRRGAGRRLVQRLLAGPARPEDPAWSAPVLDAVGVEEAMLPELAAGTQPSGRSRGLRRAHRPVAGHGGGGRLRGRDGGHPRRRGVRPGEVCDVVGTAEPVCAASAEPGEDPAMLVECHPHADPDVWLLENPGFVSGGNLRWWRDQFAP